MIDFVRTLYRDKSTLENYVMTNEHKFQDVDSILNHRTGEVKYPYRTKVQNVEINITEKFGYIKGSLHKFYNAWKFDDEQNYNDFTYSNLIESLDFLSSNIIDFESTPITQLEVGLNISLDITPVKFLKNHVLFHDLKGLNLDKNYRGGGKMYQFDYTHYYIKIYDKGKMFKLKENILRFEVKFLSKKMLHKYGVFTLKDLRDKKVLRVLFKMLLEKFDEMLIIDEYDTSLMDSSDSRSLGKYTNTRFWNHELKSKSRTTKANHAKRFKEILEKYNLLTQKQSVKSKLIQKYIYFINN